MTLIWSDFSAFSDTEEVSLFASRRSQQILLSALNYVSSRGAWETVDDATWDDIEASIAESYEEVMEEVMIALPKTLSMYRETSQAAITAGAWGAIIPTHIVDPDSVLDLDTTTGIFTFNTSGRININLLASIQNAATAVSLKQVRLYNVTDNFVYMLGTPTNVGGSAIVRHWLSLNGVQNVSAGDEFQFQLFANNASNTTILSDAQLDGLPSLSLQISMIWFPVP